MGKSILNLLPYNITIIDARPFPSQLISNSIWFGIEGIMGGWATFIPSSEPYIIYDHPKYVGLTERKLKEQGFLNIMGSFSSLPENSTRGEYKPEIIDSSQLIKSDYKILDVRRPDEWALGVIKAKDLIKL